MAEQVSSGLTQAAVEPVIQGKPTSVPKGTRYTLPVAPSTGVMPSSILEDMERIYQQRLAAQSPFQDWIKDVLAWGGTEKPGTTLETVRRRSQEKEDREAELFQMRSQIAAAKAQQQQLANQASFLRGLSGPQTAPGAPGMAGAPGAGQLPAEVLQAINEKMGMGDVAGAQAILDNYRKTKMGEEIKFITNPATYARNVEIVLPDGRIEIVDPLTARRMAESGQGVIVPSSPTAAPGQVSAPPAPAMPPAAGAPAPAMPTAAGAPAALPPLPTGAPVAEAPPPLPVAETVPVSKTTDQFRFENLTEEQITGLEKQMLSMGVNPRDIFRRPGAAEDFNRRPLEIRQRAFAAATEGASAIPTSGQAPAAPAQVAQAPTPQPRPTLPEARARLEAEKEERKGMAEREAKQFEAFLTATEAPVAIDRAETAREIIDITKQRPQIVGILQNQGVASALATLLQSGVSISGGHSVGMKDLDEAIFRARPGTKPEDIAARDRLRTLLEKTAFHLSTIIKGQGQVTEFERTLLQQVAGSIRSTPENIIKIQQSLMARAELDQKLGEMYSGRAAGMTYSQFKATDQYKNAVKAYEDRLRQIQKEKVTFPAPPAPGAPKSGTAPGGLKWRVVP